MQTENIQDIYEVSPIQHGILFHSVCASELALYFVQLGFTWHGQSVLGSMLWLGTQSYVLASIGKI
jgi:hypothetical protein